MNDVEFEEYVKQNKKCEYEKCPHFKKEKQLKLDKINLKHTVNHLNEVCKELAHQVNESDKKVNASKEIIRGLARIVREATTCDLITDTYEILYQATLFLKKD